MSKLDVHGTTWWGGAPTWCGAFQLVENSAWTCEIGYNSPSMNMKKHVWNSDTTLFCSWFQDLYNGWDNLLIGHPTME